MQQIEQLQKLDSFPFFPRLEVDAAFLDKLKTSLDSMDLTASAAEKGKKRPSSAILIKKPVCETG